MGYSSNEPMYCSWPVERDARDLGLVFAVDLLVAAYAHHGSDLRSCVIEARESDGQWNLTIRPGDNGET